MRNVQLVQIGTNGRAHDYRTPKPIKRPRKAKEATYEDGFRDGFVAASVAFVIMVLFW